MNDRKNYLLLGVGDGYKDYRFYDDMNSLMNTIQTEGLLDYEIIQRKENGDEWKTMYIVKGGKLVPGGQYSKLPFDNE